MNGYNVIADIRDASIPIKHNFCFIYFMKRSTFESLDEFFLVLQLGIDFLNFIRVLCVEQVNGFLKMFFDRSAYVHRSFAVDEVDRDAVLAKTTGSSDAMQICFAISPAIGVHR